LWFKLGVMAGLVPAIHVLKSIAASKTWMPGTRPGMTMNLWTCFDIH